MPRNKIGKSCSLWFCDQIHHARGYCHKHYDRELKYGNPLGPHDADLIVAIKKVQQLRNAIMLVAQNTMIPANVWLSGPMEALHGLEGNYKTNVVGVCSQCVLDIVVSINWPNVDLICGCNQMTLDLSHHSDIIGEWPQIEE